MSTSGTVATTNVSVVTLIEQAAKRAGVQATQLNAEQLHSARTTLQLLLYDLPNRGVTLWTVQKYIQGLNEGQASYELDVGIARRLQFLRRTVTWPAAATSSTATSWLSDFTAVGAQEARSVRLTFSGAGTNRLVTEYSQDNVNWTTADIYADFVSVAGEQRWLDINRAVPALYWRVRELTLASGLVSTAEFVTSPQELPMFPLNRDQYFLLPNKDFRGDPLQYWYDMQAEQHRVWLWPVPRDSVRQMVIWAQRYTEDVGQFTDWLEIPKRWLEGVVLLLGSRLALELPKTLVEPGRWEKLETLATQSLRGAEGAEDDGSNVVLLPNLRRYR